RPATPGDRLGAAHEPPDGVGLLDVSARRIKVDRTLRVLDAGEEAANAHCGALVDLAFDGDPAVAARPAGVRSSLGKIDRQPGRKPGLLGRRFLCAQCT